MAETRRHDTAGNQGIQANTVTADVLAVGTRATATRQTMIGETPQAFQQAIAQLRIALDGLALPAPAKQVLAEDVQKLTTATTTSTPDTARIQSHLKSLCDKLKMVGIVIKDITEIWEPINKIAKLAIIPLHLIGL